MAGQTTAPKTVLISLDGATYSILKNYLDTNQLDPNTGLGLLKSKGLFAPNTTITPSLTAPSHIAIATGSSGANNDINSNSFHLVASPFTSNISGFGAPIGGYDYLNPDGPKESTDPTAQPLWLNLRASGKKVVAATFPGADGVNVTVPGLTNSPIIQSKDKRTVDYTVPFGAFGGVSAKGFNLTASNFTVDPTQATNGLNSLGVKTYSPVKVANLETISNLTGGSGSYNIQAAAIDTTNDGTTNYDTLVFFDANKGIVGSTSLPSTGSAFVKASDKKSSPFFFDGSTNKVGTGFYVTNLSPDLSTVRLIRYSGNYIPRPAESPGVIANVDDINNNVGSWGYQADFRIPERLDNSFNNFPDSELEAAYEDQVKQFIDYQTKVLLRSIQQNPGADLVLGYIEQPDGSEHQFLLTDPRQPTDFTNPNSILGGQDKAKIQRYQNYTLNAYKVANDAVQKVIDAVGVDSNGVPNSNIIVVSDHGFAPFHTAVSINNILKNAGFDTNQVRAVSSGPAVNVYINLKGREPNGTVDPADYPALQQKIIDTLKGLKDTNTNYAPNGAVSVFDKVYSRPVPAKLTAADITNSKSDFIGQDSGDVFALLSLGYNFDGTQSTPVKRLGDDPNATSPVLSVPNFYGAHGYDPNLPEMQAIFLAAGPSFSPNPSLSRSSGGAFVTQGISPFTLNKINNIDVAPTVEKLLGVPPASTVQGSAAKNVGEISLLFNLTLTDHKNLNELGAFVVDDDKGTINGIAPGNTKEYIQAALKRSQIIFGAVPNALLKDTSLTRQLTFPQGARVGFYLVSDNTSNKVLTDLASGVSPDKTAPVFFNLAAANGNGFTDYAKIDNLGNSSFKLSWEETPGGGNRTYNGAVVTVQPQTKDISQVSPDAGSTNLLLDLRNTTESIQTKLVTSSEAAYKDFVGYYKISDTQGTITLSNGQTFKPGNAGYAQAAMQQAQQGFGLMSGDLNGSGFNRNNTSTDALLTGGLYAPFLIINGDVQSFLAKNGGNDPNNGGAKDGNNPLAYFAFVNANPDKVDHIRGIGANRVGFEDLFGGGDRDYNDIVLQLNPSKAFTTAPITF